MGELMEDTEYCVLDFSAAAAARRPSSAPDVTADTHGECRVAAPAAAFTPKATWRSLYAKSTYSAPPDKVNV